MDAMIVFDLALALALVGLAWAVLATEDLFAAVVLFIVFGLMTALAWVRLAAPDVALAEAAIGAGVTGALLLTTLRRTAGAATPEVTPPAVSWGVGALSLAVTAGLGAAFLGAPSQGPGLEGAIAGNLAASGVEHPVTAVLLNYRAYDTLMEVVVLFAAVVAVWSVAQAPEAETPAPGPVYAGFARLALPAAAVVGAYLLWAGATMPGGAFQGGAVLGALGILALLARSYVPAPEHRAMARAAFIAGTAVFALVALAVGFGPRVAFEYPPALAKPLILLIEAVVTLSIAATLAALFFGREPEPLSVEARP
jgi:multisubunit Na+/H+ antiporter MnhB subunit